MVIGCDLKFVSKKFDFKVPLLPLFVKKNYILKSG